MSDVNRDPIRWASSMTQDKDGQYVAYHDYAVLLESHDALRSELARLREFAREVNDAGTIAFKQYVKPDRKGDYVYIDDGVPVIKNYIELIARPRRLEGV